LDDYRFIHPNFDYYNFDDIVYLEAEAVRDNLDFDLDNIDNIEFSGIDWKDYPDFCDAYIESAEYDGREMTNEELDYLEDNYRDWVYNELWNYIF
jgi:hypothetical protein